MSQLIVKTLAFYALSGVCSSQNLDKLFRVGRDKDPLFFVRWPPLLQPGLVN